MTHIIVWHTAGSLFDNDGGGIITKTADVAQYFADIAPSYGGIVAERLVTELTTACTSPDIFGILFFGDGSVATYRVNHIGGTCN